MKAEVGGDTWAVTVYVKSKEVIWCDALTVVRENMGDAMGGGGEQTELNTLLSFTIKC